MNTEEVKTRVETDLLAIIKEGQNLAEGYVEIKPGIRIKAGREREFERLCDNYYEMEFNQRIENDTDTVTPVYQKLVNLVETENEEYYISKASDFVMEVKGEVERFKALTKSFNTVDSAYNLTVKELNDLYLKRENTPEWQQRVDELNSEVKRLTENTTILTEQILAAKRNVNEALIRYAEEQMAILRDSFLKTTKEADKAPTMDHNFVLAADRLEYDSLYRLVLILKHANEIKDLEHLVCLDDMMMVTEEQKDVLTSILSNIKLYGYIKAPEKKENTPKTINSEFIEKINTALAGLDEIGKKDEKSAWEVMEERERLFKILSILNRANTSDFTLVPVWDEVYVLSEDKDSLIELFKGSRILNKLNPDYKKREQNEKLIQELYAYLDELANKVTTYKGVANLPIKSTDAIGDRAWVVIENDFDEANRIIGMIMLLQNQTDDLIPVWGVANINSNDISKFKRLANATRRFGDKAPSIPENDAEMQKVIDELKVLIQRARDTENAKLAVNGSILEEDYPLFKLLEEKYNYLEDAKVSSNLIPVDGVLIDGKYAERYHQINEEILKIMNSKTVTETVTETVPTSTEEKSEPVVTEEKKAETTPPEITEGTVKPEAPVDTKEVTPDANQKEIDRLKARLDELKAKSSHNEREREEFSILEDQIAMLENGKNSIDAVEVNGVLIASNEKEKYIQSLIRMDELMERQSSEEVQETQTVPTKKGRKAKSSANEGKGILSKIAGVRKKITAIRKLENSKFGKFIKENWKQIIAVGISTAAILYFLPQLVPAIIFANSCNAAAIPALSGALNAISAAIAPFAGITFVPGMGAINLGVSANLAGPALITALSKLGIVSVAGLTIGMGVKQYLNRENEGRLSDPQRSGIIDKISDLTSMSFDNMESNPDLSPTSLINAQIEYEASRENLTGEGLTEEEILAKSIGDEVSEILDNKPVEEAAPVAAPAPKVETDEEKRKRGEELIKLQKQRREELKKAREARAAAAADEIVVQDAADNETLKKIQDRAAEFTSQAGSTGTNPVVPTTTEVKTDKPVVEVPSAEEVISKLGENGEGRTESEPELLDVTAPDTSKTKTARVMNLLNRQPGASKTSQVIDTIVGGTQEQASTEPKVDVSADIDVDSLNLSVIDKKRLNILIEKAKNLQFSLDRTINPPKVVVDTYKQQIDAANAEIEELIKQGRGR